MRENTTNTSESLGLQEGYLLQKFNLVENWLVKIKNASTQDVVSNIVPALSTSIELSHIFNGDFKASPTYDVAFACVIRWIREQNLTPNSEAATKIIFALNRIRPINFVGKIQDAIFDPLRIEFDEDTHETPKVGEFTVEQEEEAFAEALALHGLITSNVGGSNDVKIEQTIAMPGVQKILGGNGVDLRDAKKVLEKLEDYVNAKRPRSAANEIKLALELHKLSATITETPPVNTTVDSVVVASGAKTKLDAKERAVNTRTKSTSATASSTGTRQTKLQLTQNLEAAKLKEEEMAIKLKQSVEANVTLQHQLDVLKLKAESDIQIARLEEANKALQERLKEKQGDYTALKGELREMSAMFVARTDAIISKLVLPADPKIGELERALQEQIKSHDQILNELQQLKAALSKTSVESNLVSTDKLIAPHEPILTVAPANLDVVGGEVVLQEQKQPTIETVTQEDQENLKYYNDHKGEVDEYIAKKRAVNSLTRPLTAEMKDKLGSLIDLFVQAESALASKADEESVKSDLSSKLGKSQGGENGNSNGLIRSQLTDLRGADLMTFIQKYRANLQTQLNIDPHLNDVWLSLEKHNNAQVTTSPQVAESNKVIAETTQAEPQAVQNNQTGAGNKEVGQPVPRTSESSVNINSRITEVFANKGLESKDVDVALWFMDNSQTMIDYAREQNKKFNGDGFVSRKLRDAKVAHFARINNKFAEAKVILERLKTQAAQDGDVEKLKEIITSEQTISKNFKDFKDISSLGQGKGLEDKVLERIADVLQKLDVTTKSYEDRFTNLLNKNWGQLLHIMRALDMRGLRELKEFLDKQLSVEPSSQAEVAPPNVLAAPTSSAKIEAAVVEVDQNGDVEDERGDNSEQAPRTDKDKDKIDPVDGDVEQIERSAGPATYRENTAEATSAGEMYGSDEVELGDVSTGVFGEINPQPNVVEAGAQQITWDALKQSNNMKLWFEKAGYNATGKHAKVFMSIVESGKVAKDAQVTFGTNGDKKQYLISDVLRALEKAGVTSVPRIEVAVGKKEKVNQVEKPFLTENEISKIESLIKLHNKHDESVKTIVKYAGWKTELEAYTKDESRSLSDGLTEWLLRNNLVDTQHAIDEIAKTISELQANADDELDEFRNGCKEIQYKFADPENNFVKIMQIAKVYKQLAAKHKENPQLVNAERTKVASVNIRVKEIYKDILK